MATLTYEKLISYKSIKDIKHLITEKQKKQIENLIRFYDTTKIGNRLINIKDFILCDVDDHWVGRLRIIQNKIKSDTLSEYSCKIRYGDKWKEEQESRIQNVKMNKEKFISLYGEEEGTKRWLDRNEKVKSYGRDIMIKRYGLEIGEKKWKETLARKVATMTERKKIKPYRNGQTLIEFQERYGAADGYKRWQTKNKRNSFSKSKEGFIQKFGEIEGLNKWEEYCKTMSRTTLKAFIDKYGEEEGAKKFKEYGDKIRYSSTLEYYILKYGEEEGIKKHQELLVKKIAHWDKRYSKISQILFWDIHDHINDPNCYFGELNGEYVFYTNIPEIRIFSVDFKLYNNIIEFDGTYWHSSEKQKIIDKKRDEFLIKKGYKVLRITEEEYNLNKIASVNKCINFINEKNEA